MLQVIPFSVSAILSAEVNTPLSLLASLQSTTTTCAPWKRSMKFFTVCCAKNCGDW